MTLPHSQGSLAFPAGRILYKSARLARAKQRQLQTLAVALLALAPPVGQSGAFRQAGSLDPAFELSAASYRVSEVDGQASVIIRRVGDASAPASVDFSASDGTATAGADYDVASTTTLAFAANQTMKAVSITRLLSLLTRQKNIRKTGTR